MLFLFVNLIYTSSQEIAQRPYHIEKPIVPLQHCISLYLNIFISYADSTSSEQSLLLEMVHTVAAQAKISYRFTSKKLKLHLLQSRKTVKTVWSNTVIFMNKQMESLANFICLPYFCGYVKLWTTEILKTLKMFARSVMRKWNDFLIGFFNTVYFRSQDQHPQ